MSKHVMRYVEAPDLPENVTEVRMCSAQFAKYREEAKTTKLEMFEFEFVPKEKADEQPSELASSSR